MKHPRPRSPRLTRRLQWTYTPRARQRLRRWSTGWRGCADICMQQRHRRRGRDQHRAWFELSQRQRHSSMQQHTRRQTNVGRRPLRREQQSWPRQRVSRCTLGISAHGSNQVALCATAPFVLGPSLGGHYASGADTSLLLRASRERGARSRGNGRWRRADSDRILHPWLSNPAAALPPKVHANHLTAPSFHAALHSYRGAHAVRFTGSAVTTLAGIRRTRLCQQSPCRSLFHVLLHADQQFCCGKQYCGATPPLPRL